MAGGDDQKRAHPVHLHEDRLQVDISRPYDDRITYMKPLYVILPYLFMAAVTLGLMAVPHAIVYEHPRIIFARYMREDLSDYMTF